MKGYVVCVLAVAFAAQLVIGASCPENEEEFLEQLSQCPYVDDAESCADAAYAYACGGLKFARCMYLPFIREKGTELRDRVYEQMCADEDDDFGCDETVEEYEEWLRDCTEDEDIYNTPMEEWTCEQFMDAVTCQMITRINCPMTFELAKAESHVRLLGGSKCA